MLALSEFSTDCVFCILLIFAAWGFIMWIYRGVIKDNLIATAEDVQKAYYEGFQDKESGKYEDAYDAWLDSETMMHHTMIKDFDDNQLF